MNARTILAGIGLTILSLLLALFFVFRTLFTDNPGTFHPEMLLAQLLNLAAYFGAAWLALRWLDRLVAGAILAVPALAILVLYRDPPLGLTLLTAAAVGIGIALGGLVGTWLARRPEASP